MAPSVTNLTITVPDGTSNHGDPSLLCTPTHWTSILAFFLGNYIAHAATTLSYPGEEFGHYAETIVIALLFPAAGVVRGMDAIFRCAIFATSDLMCAARAGALCMLIRIDGSEETPRPSDDPETHENAESPLWMKENNHFYWRFINMPCRMRKIHGVEKASLPPGYDFAVVPRDAVVLSGQLPRDKPIVISTSRNGARAVVAIVQTCYGAFTLYRTRGDQIARYGYAAFGLTVAPYTIMSIINLLGSVLTPSYPTMYLVRSEVMDEIDRKCGRDGRPYFDGTVGVLEEVKHEHGETGLQPGEDVGSPNSERTARVVPACQEFRRLQPARPGRPRPAILRPYFWMLAGISVGIPLAIIGGLTKFHRGDSSTHAQRVCLMSWLGFSFVGVATLTITAVRRQASIIPLFPAWMVRYPRTPSMMKHPLSLFVGYSAPAIGGFVVVAQMMNVYGDCIHL